MNILITGSISFDEIMDFPGKFIDYLHPEKLHQINVSFVVDRLERQIGGTATNIAYNASLLDGNIKLLGAVGKDGRTFIDFFKKNKIDHSMVLVDKKFYSAFGSVITDEKDNQIWGFYYGASQLAKDISLKKYSRTDSLLVISANHPKAFINFERQALIYRIPYLFDPGMAMTWIKDKDLIIGIMNCRYLVGNDYEIAIITKRIKKTVKQLIASDIKVITTLGEKGVRYEDRNQKIEVKGYKVKKVVDPTGAGDAWRGGFIAARTQGLPIKECLKLGNVMASFAIEKYGTVNHRPTSKEIEKRLKTL